MVHSKREGAQYLSFTEDSTQPRACPTHTHLTHTSHTHLTHTHLTHTHISLSVTSTELWPLLQRSCNEYSEVDSGRMPTTVLEVPRPTVRGYLPIHQQRATLPRRHGYRALSQSSNIVWILGRLLVHPTTRLLLTGLLCQGVATQNFSTFTRVLALLAQVSWH